jgi:hypothetical protein
MEEFVVRDDADLAMKIATFRFGVIADFVTGVRLRHGEKEIPGSMRTRVTRTSMLAWIAAYRNGGYRIEAADASIFVHFDVDVLRDSVMPAAYSPNPNGVDLGLAQQTLQCILSDSRVRGIEITEFCPIKDRDGSAAQLIVDLLRRSFPDN